MGLPSLAVRENGWLVFPNHFYAIPQHQLAQKQEVPSPLLLIQTPVEKHIIRKHTFRGYSNFLFSFEVFYIERVIPCLSLNFANEKVLRFFSSLWMDRENPVLFLIAEKQGR